MTGVAAASAASAGQTAARVDESHHRAGCLLRRFRHRNLTATTLLDALWHNPGTAPRLLRGV